jgi:hypothetical protein
MPTFQDARLKVERAEHHITRLTARIELLEQSDVGTIEIDPKFGNEVIKHDIVDRRGRDALALIAGDAFHNLKCALDYAWIETITKLTPSALGKFAKFPVYSTCDALEAALRGNGIDKAPRDLFKVIVGEIQPYAAGNHAIWPIHRLNIRDKHRLLIPTILYSSVSGIETQDETGAVSSDGFTSGTHQEPPWYIPMPIGIKVNKKGKASIAISFNYGNEGHETIFADTLRMYSNPILGIVERLEALV